jgi:hypothetical protein
LIIQYLLTLGEDKEHLKSIYTKIKAGHGKKLMSSITSEPRLAEVNLGIYQGLSAPVSILKFMLVSA